MKQKLPDFEQIIIDFMLGISYASVLVALIIILAEALDKICS